MFDCVSYSNYGAAVPYSSSPLCLEDVRLCLEAEQQALQGKKSSSLSNINQRGKPAVSRRRSLPGTPTRGRNGVNNLSPVKLHFLARLLLDVKNGRGCSLFYSELFPLSKFELRVWFYLHLK